ncbi:SAM-dependent methyltransferase [Salinarimonas ramus]|uniref:Methyltransferase n=1 Tax=Salinarimonas ramus TaxID=690164 RepID=A0A917QAD7_9HYPH|nr:SAM-dependent methyltransferase [Salinarimonas ramus]GGK39428.1 methyltransferase [Salinarimonas ramus]
MTSRTTIRAETSLPDAYFEGLYARDVDPWRFETSAYERAKYDATLAALERPRYARALEVGCSIGVLTRDLARRCDALVATDVAEAALAKARARCADLRHVVFVRQRAPESWPAGTFDLVVLSEVLYYLDPAGVDGVAARVRASLEPGGEVVLVHWIGETDYPLSGDEAVARFAAALGPGFSEGRSERAPDYRLDTLRRT